MNRSLFRMGLSAVLAFVLCASGSLAFAQGGTTSTISGTVVDSSGGVLPGATITAKHLATGVVTTAVSNTEGNFTLASLPTGTYEVTVGLEGFKTFVAKDIVLTSVQGAGVRAVLEVGGISEVVTVASSSEIMQTQSSTISSTINTNQITKLPLTTRSAMDFVNFLPGVSTPAGNRAATINGLPQSVINVTLDGINIQDNTNRTSDGFFAIVSPRLDAIEEVSVTTAGQGAEAGQGAVQIKFVTRSGGNTYTGSAYEYYRSDKLNANTWFNNRAGIAKPKLKQNQFGARLGGPLVVPGLLSRGKAFFFGNYEELRQPSDVTRLRTLMSTSTQAGNFTFGGATLNVLNFGASNAATAASSTVDPTIAKLLSDIRAAAGTTGSLSSLDPNMDRLEYNLSVTSKRIFPTGRIDYNLTDNHRFTSALNYNWFQDFPDTLNNFDPLWPGFPVQGGQTSIRLGWSNTLRSNFGRNLVNEARVGYSGAPVKFFDEMNVGMYTGSLAFQNGHHLNFPNIGAQLTAAGAAPIPQSRNATDLTIEDTLTWLKGNHNFTMGGSFSSFNVWLKNSNLVPRVTFGLLQSDPAQQVFTAANVAAATGVTPSSTQLTQMQNLYAFLTGRVTTIAGDARLDENTGTYQYMGTGIQRSNMDEYGFFVQDQWRWKPNFTINAGLRYSLQMPFNASNNSYSTGTLEDVCGVSGTNPQTTCNLFQPGNLPGKKPQFNQLTKGKSAYNTDWDNIAPNLGFAWTPSTGEGFLRTLMSDEFVVRGGYARAYSRNGMGDFTVTYNQNPGVVVQAQRSEGLGNIGTGPVLFRDPANLAPGAFPSQPVYPMTDLVTEDIRIFDPNIKIPYADSWSFGMQRKVSTNMALEARYVGTLSREGWLPQFGINYNSVNIIENNFLNEFRQAQSNLRANIAAGQGATFRFTGAAGTAPLPNMLGFLSGQPASQANNPAAYTGTLWANATLLAQLAERNPNPFGMANTFLGNAGIRNSAAAAGIPANFFVANPDLLGGAFVVQNRSKTDYHSVQLELRRRLAQGLQFQSSYVYGQAMESRFISLRVDDRRRRDVGSPGDLTHQFKANIVYDLPFGQGRRFLGGAGPIVDRLVGGWQIGFNTRVQSGLLTDMGNVRLVGWTADDVQKAYKLRFVDDAKQIYMFPEDVITNTIRAFSVSATSASGYAGVAPEGRYFAPANGSDCIEPDAGQAYGDCGVGSLVLTGPMFHQSDLRVGKRTTIKGRVNFEVSAEALNVFNSRNFIPVVSTSTTQSNWLVTGLTGTNTSRVVQLVGRINW